MNESIPKVNSLDIETSKFRSLADKTSESKASSTLDQFRKNIFLWNDEQADFI